MTRYQDLRRKQLSRESAQLPKLLDTVRARWWQRTPPSLALREIGAVRRLLERYSKR